MPIDPKELNDSYAEYARKMDLFMDGPKTTQFQQLLDAGIQLPEPDSVADADIRTKLWEVIAGLEKLRAFLQYTNHLSDRELYSKLWHEVLRVDTPAVDEIGFNSEIQLLHLGEDDAETALYFRYYAGQEERDIWAPDLSADFMPPHEDPPFDRDDLLPGPDYTVPEAAAWLRANWSEHAFATSRFGRTANALAFVGQLLAMGATRVCVDNVTMQPNHGWTPYADTLLVGLPEDAAKRSALFYLMEHVGKPSEDGGGDHLLMDSGQNEVRLRWA